MDVLVDIWNDTKYIFAIEHVASLLTYMEDNGIRGARSVVGHSRPRVSSSTAPRGKVQDVLDEAEEREGGGLSGGVDLEGEEVVLTSHGAGVKDREKRKVVDRDDLPPETGKRVRQSRIDEVYDKEKQSHFCDKFLQWVYGVDIAFDAFRRQSWRKVRKASKEMPRGVRMRFRSFKKIGGPEVPSQKAKVATLLREVREAFAHSGTTMLSDGRKSRDSRRIVNFLAAGANGALLYATICRDGSVPETGAIVYRRWRAIMTSFPAKDVIAFCTDSASNYVAASKLLARTPTPMSGASRGSPTRPTRDALESTLHDNAWASIPWERRLIPQARWVRLQICDGQFWRQVKFAILVMEPVHQLLRRMDRGGMMMSIVYEWSQHLVQLMRLSTILTEFLTQYVREVEMRLMHLLEPAHAAAHLLNPRRRSLRDYLVVRAQIRHFHARRGDWGDRLLSDADVDAQDCNGDNEAARCAAWWFAHGVAHPELRAIAIRVMHMWTSASPAERNWVEHKRIQTGKRNKLGFATLAQLVEITTNLKLASCRQHGGGVGGLQDGEDDWANPEDLARGGDRTAEQVYFMYGAGSDGLAPRTSVITDDGLGRTEGVGDRPSPAPPAGCSGQPLRERDRHLPPLQRRKVHGVDSSGEDMAGMEEHPMDARFNPSHHSFVGAQQLRRSRRLAGQGGAHSQHLDEIPVGEQTPVTPTHGRDRQDAHGTPSSLRTSDFNVVGSHGRSPVLRYRFTQELVHGRDASQREETTEERDMESGGPGADDGEAADVGGMLDREEMVEKRDARLDREEEAHLQSTPRWEGREAYESEQRRLRELETGAVRPGRGSQMESGGSVVGLATLASYRAVEGEHAPKSGGGTDGRPIGDGGDQDAGDDSSDAGDEGEAADVGGFIDRVIVGLCAGDMEGGTPGAHGTSQVGDVVMEEAGLRTDRQGSDTGAGHSPVMEGVVGVDEEAQLSPMRDTAGDMSLALIVRPPSFFYADEGNTGCQLDERMGKSTPRALDQEQLERAGMEDPYDYTSRRSDPRRPPDGFASPPRPVERHVPYI
ncbi:hypothetical protein CBR_g32030 [Chara braunii]|uniref:DUF659 domain-containing protein n=1 Tax=Chara braunii TaxID=69332 RepID=A0A388LGG5_CHABU|nr:hypothetical protein CBR_g32030 [Chara braunii]|eukprot:GBG81357.1 hypothetical protein CBR_g32030 [Chara braunii]